MPVEFYIPYDTNSAPIYAGAVLSIVFLSIIGLYWHINFLPGPPLPPGPPARLIVGNILEVSPKGAWNVFTQYKQRYGDLVFFHGLGNKVLVLNSMKSINDLLDKRGNVYSHRPIFTVVGELMGLGQSMPLLPYGNEWREHRKLAHVALNPAAVRKYHTVQEDLAAMLCNDLLKEPEDFFSLVRLTSGRIILSVTYGLSAATADSEYITHAEETMELISRATVPGAFLCDLLPFLKYLPSWVPFRQEAIKGKAMIEDLVTKPFLHVKRELAMGTASPSLTQTLLHSDSEDLKNFEHRIKWTTGAMYGAGGETTYATVLTFMMAMALYPDKQKLAQAEIDKVVGVDRIPTIADRPNLTYVNALIKETMRWHPVLPLSIARRTAMEDTYDGYLIPKDTIVIPNVWAIAFSLDEQYCPTEFIPERFLDPTRPVIDPLTWNFGFGRRVCPGKALAENSVFIMIASILSSFDISAPRDCAIIPDFEPNLVSYPKPYKCCITPRSNVHKNLVQTRVTRCNT